LALAPALQPCIVVVEDIWAQCDTCQKWRRLPAGAAAPPDDAPWWGIRQVGCSIAAVGAEGPKAKTLAARHRCRYCKMNPDKARNSCKSPEEVGVNSFRVLRASTILQRSDLANAQAARRN
jgi:hypothetical protein